MASASRNGPSGVVILGGGIAGIAAALELLEAGWTVTLVEARRFLGGRAFSFPDAATGLDLDNGQHVFVGCCTQLTGFLDRLGARESWFLQERLRIPVKSRSGKVGCLAASRLPPPLHLLPSFLAFPHLSPQDKLRTLYGMLRARLADRQDRRLEEITFHQWLRECGQSEQAISNLWNLVVEPTLNDNVRDVSAALGLMIVQEGMLSGARSGNLGYATDSLLVSLGDPAERLLRELGADLVLGDPVSSVTVCPDSGGSDTAGRVTSISLSSGHQLHGEAFVSALPFSTLPRLLPPQVAVHQFFSSIGQLEWSPILNLHFHYDRPVMTEPVCAFVDSPLQWVFNRNRITGQTPASGGQAITVSVSAAWEYMNISPEALTARFTAEMKEAFPEAGEARVLDVRVVKQREATFRCLPGTSLLRPGPVTPVSNLFLAGEWTNTGWPSTMEGAVRSGYTAARAVIQEARLQVHAEPP